MSAAWTVYAHGSYERMQLGRRSWEIPELKLGKDERLDMQHAYPPTNDELPFPFGYGADAKDCREGAAKHKKPLAEGDDRPCHGVMLTAWRA